MRRFVRLLLEIISLQTPKGRLIFFGIASFLIFITPYYILGQLSLWQRVGFTDAPSIGLTRAYWHILHLDIAAAWERNKLIFVVLAIGLPLLTRDVISLLKPKL